jgi:hypothetical protein
MRSAKAVFIFFLPLIIPVYMYGQRCDSIPWSMHHGLKWRYFKGKPDKKSTASAISEPHIYFHFTVNANHAGFTFSCTFSTCHSWVKKVKSKNLLQHEQTHFDIAEYYKRLLVKEIRNQHFTAANIAGKVETIGNALHQLRKEADDLYDRETEHSVNEQKQKEWYKRMRKLIKGLRHYRKPGYVVVLH